MPFLYVNSLRAKRQPEKCLKQCYVRHHRDTHLWFLYASVTVLKSPLIFLFVLWAFTISGRSAYYHQFILIGKKVNEVLTAIITLLTFTSFQLRSHFVLPMNRSKDCFIKGPVFSQASLPIPLLGINNWNIGVGLVHVEPSCAGQWRPVSTTVAYGSRRRWTT